MSGRGAARSRATIRAAAAPLVAALLAAAGCDSRSSGDPGGGGAGATIYDANGNVVGGAPGLGAAVPEARTFELFSDETDLETGGVDAATLTATLIDGSRNPVAGETVTWSADGGVLQDVVATTDANGVASATLRMPRSYRNADVAITVAAGDDSETITVRAFGTELDVRGLQRSVVAGEELEAVLTLTSGDGEPIANRPVTVRSAAGNTVVPEAPVTDEDGVATVLVGSAAGGDTITVGALDDPSLTQSFEFDVSADRLEFSTASGDASFDVDSVDDVRVRWTSGGAPVAFRDLRVSTTAGQIVADPVLRTDADGYVELPVSSSAAGTATITVEDLDGDPVSDFEIAFVATVPALLDVGATSTRVYVDGTSRVNALVRDVNGNPVAGREVAFASPNLRGGQLSPATAVTDAAGRASATFRAGGIATEIDAVRIVASTVDGPAITDAIALSVVERRLNVSIGRGAGLFQDGLGTQNWKNMVVQVADGSGSALPGAEVSLSITPIEYYKGEMTLVDADGAPAPRDPAAGDGDWSPERYEVYAPWGCPAEDVPSLNRSLDPGEDVNGNGRLDPQDPAVLAAIEGGEAATLDANGTLVTGDAGTGHFRMVYPKGNANWVTVRVTARASHLGTEAQDSLVTSLPQLAEDAAYGDNTPPNYLSPYGRVPDCADPR